MNHLRKNWEYAFTSGGENLPLDEKTAPASWKVHKYDYEAKGPYCSFLDCPAREQPVPEVYDEFLRVRGVRHKLGLRLQIRDPERFFLGFPGHLNCWAILGADGREVPPGHPSDGHNQRLWHATPWEAIGNILHMMEFRLSDGYKRHEDLGREGWAKDRGGLFPQRQGH